MFKNYFLIASRNLWNNLSFSSLNIIGLSLGIASCLVIGLFVYDQFSYDKYHKNADNIYRIVNEQKSESSISRVAVTQGLLGPELKKNFAEIKNVTRVGFTTGPLVVDNKQPTKEKLMAVDSSFFSIFTFNFKVPPTKQLTEDEIYISESASIALFGNTASIGKIISIPGFVDLKVAAVFNNLPYQTHLKTDYIISFYWIEQTEPAVNNWSSNSYYNYLLMPDNFNVKEFNNKMNDFVHQFTPPSWKSFTYFLQPMTKIHFAPGYLGNPVGSLGFILIMGCALVGIMILLLACLNYMNLATARSVSRSLEVGVRKVMGAYRSQIISQFLVESFILCFLSFLMAILWADFGVAAFNAFTGYTLTLSTFFTNYELLSWLIGSLIFITLLAGSYPSFFLSKFIPVDVLKGQRKVDASKRIRKILVVAQFSFTTVLIILVGVVFKQTYFLRNHDLGFSKNNMVVFYADRDKEISLESFKKELQKIPGVKEIATATGHPSQRMNTTSIWERNRSEEESIKTEWLFADHDYIPALELTLVAGRNFNANGTDVNNAIINEEAAAALGWTPEEALGKNLSGFAFNDSIPSEIIGVIKNFHIASLRKEINPLVIGYSLETTCYMVRIDGNNLFATRDKIDEVGEHYTHGQKLESLFIEDVLEMSYLGEKKTGQLLTFFTILAIILGCSGLYAMAAYEAEQRIKELGIRKIMGATTTELMILLSRSFLKPIMLSLIAAIPSAYYLGNIWLKTFPYRIAWSIEIFALSSMAIILIGWFTVLSQAVRASRLNPVDALRYE